MHLSNKPSGRRPRAIRWWIIGAVVVVVGLAAFGLFRYYTSPGMVLARTVRSLAEKAIASETYKAGAPGGAPIADPTLAMIAGTFHAEIDVIRSFTPRQLRLLSRTHRVPFSALDEKQQELLRAAVVLRGPLVPNDGLAEHIEESYIRFNRMDFAPYVVGAWEVRTPQRAFPNPINSLDGVGLDKAMARRKAWLARVAAGTETPSPGVLVNVPDDAPHGNQAPEPTLPGS